MLDLPRHFARRVARFEAECARIRRGALGQDGVVLLGDSLAEQYKGALRLVNRGISSDHLHWPEINVFERLGSERLHPDPRAIVTLIGINDVADAPEALERHVDNYRHLLGNLRRLYPRARLAAVSLLPTHGPLARLNAPVAAFNRELEALASSFGAAYWDLHARLLDPASGAARTDLVRRDGVHLTRRGYAAMSALFLERAADVQAATRQGRPDAPSLERRTLRTGIARAAAFVRRSFAPSGAPANAFASAIDRHALARRLVAAYGREAWREQTADPLSEARFLRTYVLPAIDLLCAYAASGAPLFRDLYLGSRATFFANNARLWAGEPDGLRGAIDREHALWLDFLAGSAEVAALRPSFERTFAELRQRVACGAPRTLKLLLVGDCLLEDAALLLSGQLLPHGLLVDGDLVLSRNPVEQRASIEQRRGRAYDGVVYSPLSWDFDPEFRNFLEPSLRWRRTAGADLDSIWRRVSSTIRLLAESFESPVYVHNTAAVARAATDLRRAVKAILSYPQRRFAREELSRRIAALIDETNAAGLHHLLLVDELSAVRGLRDDLDLGRLVYSSGGFHPAALGCEVSARLAPYLVAASRLLGKKVVVCDLDDTLWDGVVGEGHTVRSQRGRQRILKQLKQRGVLLAVSSKNDPAQVKWDDAELREDDFAAREISWRPKSAGMRSIRQALNLEIRDFVFVEDRADERALLAEELPELTTLDPWLEQTWHVLSAWAALLGPRAVDRTSLYRERAQREELLAAGGAEQLACDLFARLELTIAIRRASAGDLKRVHELVNRTNQWNLLGTRCTLQEVRAWHESPSHAIYTAEVSDRFGGMGIVCCCVVEYDGAAAHIRVFVLSCRVFGYGVETALLGRVKKDAAGRFGSPSVRGVCVETPHNAPCRSMYGSHGFAPVDGAWVYAGGPSSAPEPVWLREIQ